MIVFVVVSKASDIDIFSDGEHWKLNVPAEEFEETHTHGQAHGMTAPMPGKIVKIFAKQGDTVNKGYANIHCRLLLISFYSDALLSMEAMKMEVGIGTSSVDVR